MKNIKISTQFRSNKVFTKVFAETLAQKFANEYAKHYEKTHPDNTNKITRVEFGKQDTRGSQAITLMDDRHCQPHQEFFSTQGEMVEFMRGFMRAMNDAY